MGHLISTFVGQLAVKDKSNKIKSILKLLELLDVRGTTAMIDAMRRQKNIAQMFVDDKGGYLPGSEGESAAKWGSRPGDRLPVGTTIICWAN